MSVIPITLFFSLLLAGTFVVLFAREHRRRRFASAERDSLLPLADEQPRAATAEDDDHDHAREGGRCGCLSAVGPAKEERDGSRPPCAGLGRRGNAPHACRCRENRGEGGCRRRREPSLTA